MSHLVRAAALGVAALALALPGNAAAAKAKKPKHTVTVNTVDALPKTTLKNLSRSCGKSKSASRIRKRSTSRPTKNRVRTVTTYCSGGTRTVFWIKKVTKVVTVPAPVPAPLPAPAKKGFRLTLLHNNDGESKYVVGDSVANYGGLTRFKTVLDRAREAAAAEPVPGNLDKGAVTVSSGDNFLAGLNLRASFQRFDSGAGPFYDSDAIAGLGYDAVTIGNHEYDFGPARLAEFVAFERSGVPFITANTDFRGEPLLQALRDNGRIADSAVVEKGGQQIGIIGVSPPETPTISSTRNVKFASDVAQVVNAEAQRLTNAGVNKIILSSHLQSGAVDRALVPQLKNVDIVISGGADDLLANPGDPLVVTNPVSAPVGPYPTLVADSSGTNVPIVTTQGEYRYLGRLTVNFDAAGKIVSTDAAKSGPIRITADANQADYVPEDAKLKAAVTDPLVAYKASLAANVIGTSAVNLDGGNPNPIRVKESNLGNLVADAFLAGVNRTAAADGRPPAQVAFSNGGGIRNTIAAGPITEKSTFDVLPFDNVLVTVPGVTPQKFKDLMEWGVAARVASESTGDGRFPQISGFKIVWSLSGTPQVQTPNGTTITTPGTRIRSITLDDGTPIIANGAVAPGAPNVNLATTNFTANNGDRYPFNGLPQFAAGVPYQQSLFDFIVQDLGGSVTAADYPVGGEGRITQVP